MDEGYSICFNEWALDQDIKNELGLLLIISSLTAEKGYCYASNEYFAKLFNVEQETISRKIKKLEDKNYITIDYKKRGCHILSREIRLTKISIDDYQKYQSTIDEKVKENNISINNISINKKENIKRKVFKKPTIDEIQNYCDERNNSINAVAFYDFYESKDWMVGKNKMKDWRACVRTWEQRNKVARIENKGQLPEWWNKDFKEERTDEERREIEAIKNGTYRA